MSGNVGFGGPDSGGSWSAGSLYSDGIPLPVGRAMANGSTNAAITALFGYVGGHYSGRNITLQLGNAITGVFYVPAQSSSVGTGYRPVNPWIVNGGTTRFVANGPQPGGLYFGHGGPGQTVGPGGYVRPGTLGGAYSWIEAPAAPSMLSATPGQNGAVTLRFSGSGDTGGAAITGWAVQYATNPSFTTGVGVIDGLNGTVTTNLAPGTTYWFRAAGRNWVTDASSTYGPWSGAISATTQGLPSAPKSLSAVNSTSVFNQVQLSWSAPDFSNGTLTGYDIYDGTTKIGSTSGTGTTYNTVGFTDFSYHTLTVRARNSYADSIGSAGPDSNAVSITTSSAPTAVRSLTAVASGSTPGKITLSWTAPATAGVGGITKYSVYQSTGALLAASVAAGTTTYDVLNLNPSTTYGFYVVAWNAIATTVGTPGTASNVAFATTLGAPDPVTSMSLTAPTTVAGRLILLWDAVANATGYNIYEIVGSSAIKVGSTTTLRDYVFDDLSAGPHTYMIRTRNTYTDQTGTEGPDSTTRVTGTAGTSSTQSVVSGGILNEDSSLYSGTQVLTAVTNTSISFAKVSPDKAVSDASSGTLTDTSNQALNGTFTITSVPNETSLTYAATLSNIAQTPAYGSLVDNTNVALTGTHTVTASDENNAKVSYSATVANHALVPATGTIVNNSNVVYNTTGVVLADVTSNTLVYGKTNADLAETLATGTATDITNRDIYNGDYSIESVPTFDTLVVPRTAADQTNAPVLDPGGDMFRTVSAGALEVRYRSGWLG